jgi:hypothetical protein
MQTASEYLKRTKSAVQKLFEGIDSYTAGLERARTPVFVSSMPDQIQRHAELEAWMVEHAAAIQASLAAQRDYFAESFALATLCGAVLQVAAKGLERFSTNMAIPEDWADVIKARDSAVRYCVGRRVRHVPLGLIIYAGRNQHVHFGEGRLNQVNMTVFARLAVHHGRNNDPTIRDPAFDLSNSLLLSFAHNVTTLIDWRSYEAYERDFAELLAVTV